MIIVNLNNIFVHIYLSIFLWQIRIVDIYTELYDVFIKLAVHRIAVYISTKIHIRSGILFVDCSTHTVGSIFIRS